MATLRYRGREIHPEDILYIRTLIEQHPDDSRRKLSTRLCEAWDWRQSNSAFGQLPQRQGTQNNTDLLHTAAQEFGKLFLILWRDIDTQGWTTHTPSIRRNNST